MRILITGGGGYLGTVLVRRLLEGDERVRVFDRFSWGTQPLASVTDAYRYPLEVITGDIRNRTQLADAINGSDAIIHLAAIVGYPACDADPEDADTTNVEGTRLLPELAEGRPILFASTGSCYGRQASPATEESPLSPLTRYGRNKAEAEKIVLDAGGVCLRLATLYGLSPRMRWDLLPHDFARRGVAGSIHLYDPNARRTFLHVEDAAWAFERLLGSTDAAVYNVGHTRLNLTKLEIAAHVQTLTDCVIVEAQGFDPDGRDYEVDYTKMAETRWSPSFDFDLTNIVTFARVWR